MIIEVPTTMQLREEETSSISSNGKQYICKQVYEDNYQRITNWYSESGAIVKQKVQDINQ